MLKLPNFLHSRYMEEVRLSVLDTGRLYPPGDIPETHFERMNRPYGHSANGRIMSMKNPYDSNGSRTHKLLVCSALSQPTIRC